MLSITVFGTLSVVAQPNSKDNESRLQKVQSQIKSLESSINRYKGKRASEYKKLQQAEVKLSQLNNKEQQTKQSIKAANQQLSKLNKQYKQLLPKKRAQERLVRQELQTAYKSGKQDKFKLLLNQDNSEQVARMLEYYKYIGKARSEKINEFLATMVEINQVLETTQQKKIELSQLQSSLVEQRKEADVSKRDRQKIVSDLSINISSAGQRLDVYKRQSKELQQLIESVLDITDSIILPPKVNIASVKGKLTRPVKGKIVNRYNSKRVGGLKWTGVFITAPESANVSSVYYGHVVFSGYLRGLGLLIIIDHGNDYLSLYGHNQTLKVKVGEQVTPKQVIAQVGNTGGQEKTGLYFEFRHKGKTNNPSSWVKW